MPRLNVAANQGDYSSQTSYHRPGVALDSGPNPTYPDGRARLETGSNDSQKAPRWVRWGGGVALAAVIAGGIGGIAYNMGSKNSSNSAEGSGGLSGTEPVASVQYDPADTDRDGIISPIEAIYADGTVTAEELNTLPDPTQTEFVDPADLVSVYANDFDAWRQQTKDILIKKGWLTNEQLAVLAEMPDAALPKEQWTDQMVLNAISLDIADSMIQEPRELGVRMLPTVLDPETPSFAEVREDIGEYVTVNILKTDLSEKPRGSEFMGITELSPNARVIIADYVRDRDAAGSVEHSRVILLVDLEEGKDNSSQTWRELGAWDSYDPSAQAAFRELVS